MPKIVGKTNRVVTVSGLFSIDELIGNVATNQDHLSVAHVVNEQPREEPWLNPKYDEWYCVLKGKVEFHYSTKGQQAGKGNEDDLQVLTVQSGETAFIGSGERVRPVFPVGDTEVIAVCSPAFSPDRCIREEEGDNTAPPPVSSDDDIIYHMCEETRWMEAFKAARAYYPPTFEKDGGFAHATKKASLLLNVANHYYQSSKDDWICVALSKSALEDIGIVTRFEEAKPVGETGVMDTTLSMPHIFGGIPARLPGIVKRVYPIKRDETGKFLSIEGLSS
mmetsp:Transcript_4669/g.10522  ORF Transcript_4669/g.10522 Transcript_4669/m.10522 type:complete len:278 (+) Transcript_4669:92-925(+)